MCVIVPKDKENIPPREEEAFFPTCVCICIIFKHEDKLENKLLCMFLAGNFYSLVQTKTLTIVLVKNR